MRAERNTVHNINATCIKMIFCTEEVDWLHWHFNDQWTEVFQHKWMMKKIIFI